MTIGVVPVFPRMQLLDALGVPLANGTVDVYLAGSTTRSNTWQDRSLTTLNTNPIVLDAAGSCAIFMSPSLTYKFVVTSAVGVIQSHLGGDNVSGAVSAPAAAEASQSFTASSTTWNLVGTISSVTKIFIGGIHYGLANFSIAGNAVTYTGTVPLNTLAVVVIYYL